ncbi:hypothetical protein QR680_001860 [Steinernema hermaphroditum]|uniref:Intimal thickness related receptor IRP domain-containing protein n=1 Tax=Steinernema hermaphroditum TaxID=289476 RepID=A0AA39H106_9BILA|nr:hypothetical protein QR680_001860 [Steinernema hermaphroditum]
MLVLERKHWFQATALFALLQITHAKYSSGVLISRNNWEYLERFCFVSQSSSLYFFIEYPKKYEIQTLYLYFDTETQWESAYNDSVKCRDKEALLDPTNNQILNLSPQQAFGDGTRCWENARNNESWYSCEGRRSFTSQRPRWWYLAVGNCDSFKGLYLEYSIEMANDLPSSVWFYHFSFDEFYILPVNLIFLAVELSILIAAVSVAIVLKSRKLFHQTYKLFFQSVVFECLSLFLMCTAYAIYAHNGIGSPMLKYISQICRQMANMSFLLLLLLLSKGFTITRGRLSLCGMTKLSLFVFAYAIISSSMLIWQERMFDPALVTYVSECLPAYVIAIMRIIAWLWFLRSVLITCSKYEQKKRFYTTFSCLMTFWFWSGPAVLILANFVLDNWVREEVVSGVECAVVAYGFFVFLVLTWPSAANHNFPYHVRTTQVGDTNYPQNNYEVRYTTNGQDVRIEGHRMDDNSDQSSVQREDSSSTSPEIRHVHKVVTD